MEDIHDLTEKGIKTLFTASAEDNSNRVEMRIIYPGDELFSPLFDLFTSLFPPIERNSYEGLLGYYQKADDVYQYQTIAFVEDDQVVGGCYLNVFKDIKTCIVEFLFVDAGHRRKGYATKMVQFARSIHSGFTFVIEVEKNGLTAQKFWQKMGFSDVDYNYMQPPINEGGVQFDGLKLMSDGHIRDVGDLLENHYWKYSFV